MSVSLHDICVDDQMAFVVVIICYIYPGSQSSPDIFVMFMLMAGLPSTCSRHSLPLRTIGEEE